MLRGIDISNWQQGLSLYDIAHNIDFAIMKATGGTSFVDVWCDGWVQQAIALGMPWGFYHYANDFRYNGAIEEADYFIDNCSNYFGHGIPILDWEEDAVGVDWVNTFVRHVHERTGVWCWIYANPWRFNQGGVEPNCARWIASYPTTGQTTLMTDPGTLPRTDGNVVCWQYSSNGKVGGYSGSLDLNHYYGTPESWLAYAHGPQPQPQPEPEHESDIVVEDDTYKVVITKK